MDFKFSKESPDSQQQETPGEKKNQSALLVLLLILVGGFTYIYFFTALIKPLETEMKPEAAPVQQAVKIPLPPRDGEATKPEVNVAKKAEVTKKSTAAPVTAAAPAVAVSVPATKTAPVKLREEPKKIEPAKTADKKTTGAVKEPIKKQTLDTQAKQETAVKTKAAGPTHWALNVGNYVLEETLAADMGRVRKTGLEPVIKPSVRKKTAMNRLLVSEAKDRVTAQATVERLKSHTSDVFTIEQGGTFHVYAGSYSQIEAANSEKDRLVAAGFSVTIKRTEIAIPSSSLSVGPFTNKKEAEAALVKLKSAGIKATLSQQ